MKYIKYFLFIILIFSVLFAASWYENRSEILSIKDDSEDAQIISKSIYLSDLKVSLQKKWPENHAVNLVFHGHSVPAGYFNTPNVRTLEAYPHLTLQAIKAVYPNAVVNTITTSIGGENSEQGCKRFSREVLTHHPDVLYIDYALNDRGIGLERAQKAWESMIREALKQQIKVILLTPTPDLTEDILNPDAPLEKHAQQIRSLAVKYNIGLVDSYAAFKQLKQNGEELKAYMSQSNHPNEKGHQVVCNLIIEWLMSQDQLITFQQYNIKNILQKVADWQLLNFESQVQKGSQWPNSHAYWAWTNATMYVGMAEYARLSGTPRYWNFLKTIGEKNLWKPGPSTYFADDICVVQAYQQLYEQYRDEKMIQPSVEVLNQIVNQPKTGSLSYHAKDSHSRWCWCDALFMAPTAFARMGKTTGNKQYFDFLDKEFWTTYDSLYCPQEKLFFRDTRYKTMKEENGKPVFWGRGNGWVMGGLTIIIDHLPNDYPSKQRFIDLYKEMIARIAGLQDAQGFWHSSLLDRNAYPMPETSASGFFTYGLLWGINNGYLDKKTYLPVAEKAWKALCSAVHDDGKLGYVQPIGADPKKVNADDTEVYGVGAFLLAGVEMLKLGEKGEGRVEKEERKRENVNTLRSSLSIPHSPRLLVSLNGDWKFRLDRDSLGWKSWTSEIPDARIVQVPHTWNVEDGTERFWGLGWYQKSIQAPAEWKGKMVRLQFDAVYRDAVIYLNGKKIGEHIGSGYTPFSLDISKELVYGKENQLVLSVSNKFSKLAFPFDISFDWPNDGGIIRPVSLIITGKPAIRYAHIKPEINFKDKSATASIKIKTWDEKLKKADFLLTFSNWKTKEVIRTLKVKIEGANDGIFHVNADFKHILPWHFDSPNLYTMRVDVLDKGDEMKILDSYTTRFGFRKLEIKGHQLYLNEEPVRLPGIEYMPGSYPEYGMAEPVGVLSKAVDLMKELNCVITRFHWQQDSRILDLMDEKGILVQQEIPWWQAPGNLSPELEALAKKQIDDMIERDFNRPSTFSWGVSNEVFYNTDKDIYRRLINHAKSWDAGCFVTVVSNEIFDRLENDESLLADIPTWNDYVGTWHGKVREETPDKLKLINERALRGRPLLITEHGLCEPRFVGADPRRIVEMTYHYDQWAKNNYILGCIYFSLNDYRTHRGESGKGRYQARIHGLTDLWFGKKPSFTVYAGLAAPVFFESVQQIADGTKAEVTIQVKNDLPSYTLRNYKLVWKTKNRGQKEIVLPDLKPGDKYKTTVDELDPKAKVTVQVIRPTGYRVMEN